MTYPLVKMDALTPDRSRSAELWRGALDAFAGKGIASLYADDFQKPLTIGTVATGADGWFLSEAGATGATSEGFSTIADEDGVVSLIGTTGTDLQGVMAQAGISASVGENIVTPQHTDGKGDVVFQARVYLNDQSNDTFFIGLAEPSGGANTLLLNDNTLSLALDYVGFYRLNGGDIQFVCRNDNNGNTAVSYAVNVVAAANSPEDEYVKLGFRLNANGTGEVFVDDDRIKRTSDTAVDIVVPVGAFPIEFLTRTLAVARGATNDNATVALNCDYIDCIVED